MMGKMGTFALYLHALEQWSTDKDLSGSLDLNRTSFLTSEGFVSIAF